MILADTMNEPIMGGSYAERRLIKRIQKLQQHLNELEQLVTSPPCVIIYNIQEVINETSDNWEQLVKDYLISININADWILDIINSTKSKNPESITIHLTSHCVKDKVFTIISDYFIKNDINAIVTKDNE